MVSGGETFQQVYPTGFRAWYKSPFVTDANYSTVDVVVKEDGSRLYGKDGEAPCICPKKPVWIRIVNDIFVSDVQDIMIYYRCGSLMLITGNFVVIAIYLRGKYLHRQPFASMARMCCCDACCCVPRFGA